ncbi:hypothetical protein [Methylobacterium nigriterrae]|uniref:hypothetical protein n=1 Tax=Methylobacterium nigriterrae TaxID=3127512 RepID=UPI003013839A
MTATLPIRSFECLRTVARLGSHHLMIARCTAGSEVSVAVVLDRFAEWSEWVVLARYPDDPAGLRAADVMARAVLRAGVELLQDDDQTIGVA